jgi:hypothetical protein
MTSAFGCKPRRMLSSLKMATAMFAETLDNTQHSTRLTPKSRSYTMGLL